MSKHPTLNLYSKAKEKIVICINSLTLSQQAAYSNHIQLFYRLGRHYTKYDFALWNPPRMSIDRSKNGAAELALDIEAKYLLIIDDDVLIPTPFDFLDKLIALDAPIAAADVLIRGYPFDHMFFKYTENGKGLRTVSKLPRNHTRGRFEVDAVGFSCCLITTELLKGLSKPYFVTGINNTEDIYFCVKARDKYPDCKILVDTSLICGHILWNEVIDSHNKAAYKQYFERLNGKPSKIDEAEYRGEVYLQKTKRTLNVE